MAIDVHAHYFPKSYVATLRAMGGASDPIADRIEEDDHRNRFFSSALEERVALMDETGIERQILSINGHAFLVEDPARCHDHTRAANDVQAEIAVRFPGRFSFWASLPVVDPELAVRELERAVKDLGALGMMMPTNILGTPLDWPALDVLYAYLEREGLPMFLHPHPPAYEAIPAGYPELVLVSGLYYVVEDANAVMRLVRGGVMERFPNLRVICPHLGGPVPFFAFRLNQAVGPKLPHRAEVYWKRMLFDVVSQHPPAVRCACETFGVDRFVFGTDFPYINDDGVRATARLVDDLPYDDHARAGIRKQNLLSWLKL
jgi:aminocarboxymuconate-semialdehyde decarboxylase